MGLKRGTWGVCSMYMGKPATLSETAYKAIQATKLFEKESISEVILRLVPRPLHTFGDLEAHLSNLEGPVIADEAALERLRKAKASRAH